MAFTIPDKGEGANDLQSILFQEYLDVIIAGVSRSDCVLSGCAVTAQGSPDMTVAVASGSVVTNGVQYAVTGANGTITTADGTNPRLDLVVITSAGAIAVRAGTAAAAPKPAARTANDVVLAVVYVPASDTTIASNQIVDLRVLREAVGSSTGDIITTARALSAPDWLPCTGLTYLQSSYSALYAELGALFGDSLVRLANPASLPGSGAQACDWSSDGTYLALALVTAPRMIAYSRSGDTLTKLSDPATTPNGIAYGCAWRVGASHLAVASTGATSLNLYRRDGSTLTDVTISSLPPASNSKWCSWSGDGTYLSIASGSSPYTVNYSISGDTLTKLSDPATLPAGAANCCAWSPDGVYLAVGHATSPFITIYKRSGSTLTKLANPASLPEAQVLCCAWSPSGKYLVAGPAASPYINIYQRVGDKFTKLATPPSLPPGNIYSVTWSPSEDAIFAGSITSPYHIYYRFEAGVLLKLNDVLDVLGSVSDTIRGASWTPDGSRLAIAYGTGSYMGVYAGDYDRSTQFVTPSLPQIGGLAHYIKT